MNRQSTDGATADQTAAADNGLGDWLERASSRPSVERAREGVGDKLELERELGYTGAWWSAETSFM